MRNGNGEPRWPIPTKPWGTRHKIDFDHASEETKAKFRELYPTSFNKEMAEWFGIKAETVRYVAKGLGLSKDRRRIAQRRAEPCKYRLAQAMKHIQEKSPERYADLNRRRGETIHKMWHRAKIQGEYGLPRTVRYSPSPLTKKQRQHKNHMLTLHRYFSDPDHPYWVCFDSLTTRSPRMEATAENIGLKIVEGEG